MMLRVLESLLVCLVTTVVIFMASMTLGECRDLVSPAANNTTALVSVRLYREIIFSFIFYYLC